MELDRLPTYIKLPPEQQHVLVLAFNYAPRKLNFVDRNDPVCDMVARKGHRDWDKRRQRCRRNRGDCL